MKTCEDCEGSGSRYYMKDGKSGWDTCRTCAGKGVVVPFEDSTDAVELERWLEEYQRNSGLPF